MAGAAAQAAAVAARHTGRYASHPLLPGIAQAAADACTGRLVPSWRPRAEELISTFERIHVCLPRYTEFLKKTNKKDLKKVHVFMNDVAQAKLGEFYLCCALRLRPDEIDAAGSDNDALLKVANSVATENVEPFFEKCRDFVKGYDENLHSRLNETTVWREVDDGLFWHHSFDVAAKDAYAAYREAVLPPESEWPAHEDVEGVKEIVERCTRTVATDGEERRLAEDVYQRFLEASATPVQATIRSTLIDHGIIAGEVKWRPPQNEE